MEERMPLCKIYPDQVNVFYYSFKSRSYPEMQGENLVNDRKKAYSGIMSDSAKRIIRERLTAWYYLTLSYNKFKSKVRGHSFKQLIMLTVTLSGKQVHSDHFIKKNLLELYLKRLNYTYGMENYFWKAEKQKNGNIHFHIWLDCYIAKEVAQLHWNEVQDNYGYLDEYFEKFGKRNPPSTQIEIISGKQSAIKYMMKYVTKNEGEQLVQGRLFSFSSKLLNICIPIVPIDSQVDDYINRVRRFEGFNMIEDTWFSVLRWRADFVPVLSKHPAMEFYRDYYSKLAVLFYLTDANSELIFKFNALYCGFYRFDLDAVRYEWLCDVGKYLSMSYPI